MASTVLKFPDGSEKKYPVISSYEKDGNNIIIVDTGKKLDDNVIVGVGRKVGDLVQEIREQDPNAWLVVKSDLVEIKRGNWDKSNYRVVPEVVNASTKPFTELGLNVERNFEVIKNDYQTFLNTMSVANNAMNQGEEASIMDINLDEIPQNPLPQAPAAGNAVVNNTPGMDNNFATVLDSPSSMQTPMESVIPDVNNVPVDVPNLGAQNPATLQNMPGANMVQDSLGGVQNINNNFNSVIGAAPQMETVNPIPNPIPTASVNEPVNNNQNFASNFASVLGTPAPVQSPVPEPSPALAYEVPKEDVAPVINGAPLINPVESLEEAPATNFSDSYISRVNEVIETMKTMSQEYMKNMEAKQAELYREIAEMIAQVQARDAISTKAFDTAQSVNNMAQMQNMNTQSTFNRVA